MNISFYARMTRHRSNVKTDSNAALQDKFFAYAKNALLTCSIGPFLMRRDP